jgi:hypothetical protein
MADVGDTILAALARGIGSLLGPAVGVSGLNALPLPSGDIQSSVTESRPDARLLSRSLSSRRALVKGLYNFESGPSGTFLGDRVDPESAVSGDLSTIIPFSVRWAMYSLRKRIERGGSVIAA